MKLETFQEFVTLVKCQNFSLAAKELFLSQSGLSAHISGLEKELGFLLVDRNENKFALTPAGTTFLEYAQAILGTYEEAVEKGREIASDCPPVRFASVTLNSPYYTALSKVEEIPFVFVDLDFDVPTFKALEKRVIDAGITADYSTSPVILELMKKENIVFEPIRFETGAICMMRSHPLASKSSLTREDLRGLVATISSGAHFDSWKQKVLDMVGEEAGIKFRLTAAESMANLSRADLGEAIHICSYDSIATYFSQRDDMVIFDSLDGEKLRYSVGVAYREDGPKDKIQKLIEVFRTSFDEE